MKSYITRIKRSVNRLQWQIVFTMSLSFIVICVILLGLRVRNAVKAYANISGSTVISSMARQIAANPWFIELDEEDLIQPAPAEGNARSVEDWRGGDPPRVVVPLDFGSIFRDMQIDIRYLPDRSSYIFYLDETGNVFPIVFGKQGFHEPPAGGERDADGDVVDEIIRRGRELAVNSDYDQVIVTEKGYSMALIPHTGVKSGKKGYLYIYMRDPELAEMIRPMLRSSIREILGMVVLVLILSLVCGLVFAKSWSQWFARVSQVMEQWSQGSFSEKIDIDKTPFVTEWRELAEQLNDMADQLEQVVETRQELAASEERNALARELHDNIKQQLFSINMSLGAAQVLREKNPEAADEKLKLAAGMFRETMVELDSLITAMRPGSQSDQKFMRALQKFLRNWEQSSGIPLTAQYADAVNIRDENTSMAVYRIIQEGLSNILRHSKAQRAELSLTADGTSIRLRIQDDGVGFDPRSVTGVGLASMRERVEALNGTFDLSSHRDGTCLKVYLPQQVNI